MRVILRSASLPLQLNAILVSRMPPAEVRQRWTRGAVVTIPLGRGQFAFAQMLGDPEYAFFDLRTRAIKDPTEIVEHPTIFRLWVMGSAHTRGRWKKLGPAPILGPLKKLVKRFNQDPLDPDLIRLGFHGDGKLVTRAECRNVECAAVWDPEHVESRLRDHFAGRKNVWLNSLKLR
jgi:hypothetical protein